MNVGRILTENYGAVIKMENITPMKELFPVAILLLDRTETEIF